MELEGGKIPNRQLALILMLLVLMPTAVLFAPAITSHAKQDAWISLLVVSTIYGLLVAFITTKLALIHSGLTVIEYTPKILGTFLGKIIGALYIFWLIHVNAVIVREFSDFLLSVFMPETPLTVFMIVLLLLAAWAVSNGLEVVSRAAEWVFPLFLLSIMIIIIFVLPDADFSNLLPVLENGIKPVIKGGITPSAWRGEIIIMLMLFPYVNYPKKTGVYMITAVIITGLLLSAVTAVTIAVLGGLTEYLTFPIFSLARYAHLVMFLERLEAMILVMWVAGVTVKVSCFYYATVLGTAQLFSLHDYRPIVLPIGIITAALGHALFESSSQITYWISEIWPYYAFIFEFVIPLGLLLIAFFQKRGEHKNVD